MPDRRKHRGPHPSDRELFSEDQFFRLKEAALDFVWLLNRGYPRKTAQSFVGDRYQLKQRQRVALGRSCCSDEDERLRRSRLLSSIQGRHLMLDGFNILTTVESALSGGMVLDCRDHCFRDLAGSGGFKRVSETRKAISLIHDTIYEMQPASVLWLLDRPLSNSARLKALIEEDLLAKQRDRQWSPPPGWSVELEEHVDGRLAASKAVISSADSTILDRCQGWFNGARRVIESRVSRAWIVQIWQTPSGEGSQQQIAEQPGQ